jgi:hypothetical protein
VVARGGLDGRVRSGGRSGRSPRTDHERPPPVDFGILPASHGRRPGGRDRVPRNAVSRFVATPVVATSVTDVRLGRAVPDTPHRPANPSRSCRPLTRGAGLRWVNYRTLWPERTAVPDAGARPFSTSSSLRGARATILWPLSSTPSEQPKVALRPAGRARPRAREDKASISQRAHGIGHPPNRPPRRPQRAKAQARPLE